MGYLLDAHVLLWALDQQNDKLGRQTVKILQDNRARKYISIASLWEITLKSNLGKLTLPNDFWERVLVWDVEILPLTLENLKALHELELLHKDPFDRILIAQARCGGLTLITADENILAYEQGMLSALN
jgi:PIN domain nuclease of toxin-antitoxin system